METHRAKLDDFIRYLETQWSTKACSDMTLRNDATAVVDRELIWAEDMFDTVQTTIRKLLLRLRRHHNVTRPVNKLPLEILQIVFQFAGRRGFDLRTNLSITAVCEHWREVALYYPQMWTFFAAPGPGFHKHLEMLLERSVHLPLDLAFHCSQRSPYPTDVAQQFETFILTNMHRIRSLTVDTPESFLAGAAFNEAPILEEVSLFYSMPPRAESSLLRHFVSPKLKSLDLTHCRRPWLPGMYANLTHLRLEPPPWTLPRPNEDVTVIFRESPMLESIDMRIHYVDVPQHNASDADAFEKAQRFPERLPMDRLRRVELHMPVGMLAQVLVTIELPQDIQTVRLVAFFGQETTPIRLLFSSRCIPSTMLSCLHSLRLYDGGDRLHIHGSTSSSLHPEKDNTHDALRIICHPQRHRLSRQFDILGGMVDAIRAEHTLPLLDEFLFYLADNRRKVQEGDPGQRNTAHDIANLLQHLPSITSLTLRSEDLAQCAKFFEDLRERLPPSALPALSTCTITIRQRSYTPSSPHFDAIIQFLGTLANRIKTVRFTNTFIRVPDHDAKQNVDSYSKMIQELGIADTCLPATAFAVSKLPKYRRPGYPLAEGLISVIG